MNPKIYVVTYHAFNHSPDRHPIDERFLGKEKGKYCFYLIDKVVPDILKNEEVILEYQLDPALHEAGGKYFGEWSFLLAELKHQFCTYPFFLISSRFYQKNKWLDQDLNSHWEKLFDLLAQFSYGFLPSYDRPLRWVEIPSKNQLKQMHKFFPFTEEVYGLIQDIFGVTVGEDYPKTVDLFCNYIGFNSRKDLVNYVEFYLPLIYFFFDDKYQPKVRIENYAVRSGGFRNEKPFTFIIELLSHLYFFKKEKTFFCLHYNGFYQISEKEERSEKSAEIPIPLNKRLRRYLEWQWRKTKSERQLTYLRMIYRPIKKFLLKCTSFLAENCK